MAPSETANNLRHSALAYAHALRNVLLAFAVSCGGSDRSYSSLIHARVSIRNSDVLGVAPSPLLHHVSGVRLFIAKEEVVGANAITAVASVTDESLAGMSSTEKLPRNTVCPMRFSVHSALTVANVGRNVAAPDPAAAGVLRVHVCQEGRDGQLDFRHSHTRVVSHARGEC